jgi:hypothetical protein
VVLTMDGARRLGVGDGPMIERNNRWQQSSMARLLRHGEVNLGAKMSEAVSSSNRGTFL